MSSFLLRLIIYLKPKDANCSRRKALSSLSYICSVTVVQALSPGTFFIPSAPSYTASLGSNLMANQTLR